MKHVYNSGKIYKVVKKVAPAFCYFPNEPKPVSSTINKTMKLQNAKSQHYKFNQFLCRFPNWSVCCQNKSLIVLIVDVFTVGTTATTKYRIGLLYYFQRFLSTGTKSMADFMQLKYMCGFFVLSSHYRRTK